MIESLIESDNVSKSETENELEERLRSNLHRNESDQPENRATDKTQENIEAKRRGYFSREQGEIGEGIAIRAGSEKLGLTPDPNFDASTHGFDCVSRDSQGRLCIVEAKFDARGINALRNDQMQAEWVERNARMMQNPGNERFTKGNAELGREILKSNSESVRRIVITNDPKTLEINAYEGKEDGNWELIGGPWLAMEFDQPIPEW